MLISLNWLKQYLPEGIKISDEEFKKKFTFSSAEVESIKKIGSDLDKIIIGEITKIKQHPKSDKLKIVTVDTNEKRKRKIICAASNINVGDKVPVALPGGTVLNPEQELGKQETCRITSLEIANVKSMGMLCSQKELGLSDDHEGIWILPDEVKIGDDLLKEIYDTVFEIENKTLTHRSDCFSHVGIAREVSAVTKTPFIYKETDETLIPTETLPLVVKVENHNLCKRYTAVVIKGVKIKPSPLWLQLKLLVTGIRPKNNVVDITNYVMLDVGQPLHAFDYNKLDTARIIVRTAKRGEKTVTLDNQEKELKTNHLLITDPKKPVGIAGIMGCKNSEIDKKTTDIIIESANFEMYGIRKSSMELGLRSEASTRFEKGLDPNFTIIALKEAISLITENAGGEIASEVIDIYKEPVKKHTIDFDLADIPRLLGVDIQKSDIINILESLQLEVESPESIQSKLSVSIPTFRRDLNIKEDLLEEIGRIYGYTKFKPILPSKTLKSAKLNKRREYRKKIKLALQSLNFDEVYSYSFTGKKQYEKSLLNIENCMKLKNPISSDLEYMKNDLTPGILEKINFNQPNFEKIYIYELSKIYLKEKNKENLPEQPTHITGSISENINETELFFKLKGKLESLFINTYIKNAKFIKSDKIKYLQPTQQAVIKLRNQIVGHIGLIHPQVKYNWSIKLNTALFTLEFNELFKNKKDLDNYKKISKFPSVTRDLSFWIDSEAEAGPLLDKLKETKYQYVKNIEIIDIYKKNKNIKSITLRITLQSYKGTLNENEINKDIKHLTQAIEKIGGKIRKK